MNIRKLSNMTETTIYYLEMRGADLHSARALPPELAIHEACIKQYQVNRMLYQLVGEDWDWNEKSNWTNTDWQAYAEADSLRTWIAYHQGSIAGFFELRQIDSQCNELAYFGLAAKFIGKGFGAALLSAAIIQAWQWGNPQRIIVNTCTLDHPNALPNYKARGFSIYDTKVVAG